MTDADFLAHNENLQLSIRQNFPKTYDLMQYNAKGTIKLLQAAKVITAFKRTARMHVEHTGDDNLKAWSDYKVAVLDYLKEINSDELLQQAREQLSEKIHSVHYAKFPLWPAVGQTQEAQVNITDKGGYQWSQGSQKNYVVWACEGDVVVKDVRTAARSFAAEFTGEPVLKIISVDLIKLQQFEALCSSDMATAKKKADERTNQALTWNMF
eukprot:CAMPEP_0202685112 /NCGR_PEP_ID=MMETSP1385-20130828/793_1 /ASSEMBLY_ACC=CAM_ASM_000861 /TAXON_ID=933848 /ORGANISM="Elphidium margaritaceum" /LENGTH=210 /DNA_ID=CAMNT_0049339375 /DNA_START=99 /DNA_END=731 /DNA_ORIENTATION=+